MAATTKIPWYIGGGRYENPLLDLDPDITCIDPDDVGTGYDANQYVNIEAGYTLVLRTGKDFKETVIVHVINWFVQVFDLDLAVQVNLDGNNGGMLTFHMPF